MSQSDNPFVRGYQSLSVQRLLVITVDDASPITYLPLHPEQIPLRDDQVQQRPCLFGNDFAVVDEGHGFTSQQSALCPSQGTVRAVIYGIVADEGGKAFHVGDVYSTEAAEKVLHRLRFETGFYSRCWEISSAHLTAAAMNYLIGLADDCNPTGLMFEAFRIPGEAVVGIKLIATPWTDVVLHEIDGRSADDLLQSMRDEDVPDPLVYLLYLAALADVRILIFDPDAAVLDGLPLFDEE